MTDASGIRANGYGVGIAVADYDDDGLLDLMTASGDVFVIESLARRSDPFPMHQPNQLFRNIGANRFEDVTAKAGAVFELSEVSRGLAFGDVGNDGDTDVLLENCNGRARLLINTVGSSNHWIGLRLVAGTPALDQIHEAIKTLARLLASADDPKVRDGERALELARRTLRAGTTPSRNETLAMASAEAGDFDEAVRLQTEVIRAMASLGRSDVLPRLEANLVRYRAGLACCAPRSASG